MAETLSVELPYGKESIRIEIPRANLLAVLSPRDVEPCKDVQEEVRHALQHPIGAPRLRELAKGKRKVAIVADDITRPTPTAKIIPPLLEELNEAGLADDQISLIIALGTHRPMTDQEILEKYGPEVVERITVKNHAWWDATALVNLGITPNGTPISVNREVHEADLAIGVGSIVPHHICGFGGGAKIVQPGISGAETTAATHLLSVRTRRSWLGVTENVVRQEMEEIARQAGLSVILNVVLNRQGEVVRAFYGDTALAFREGVKACQEIYTVKVPAQADIVVASSHPCDIEFWQAHKTLYPADIAVREGGTIIVVTPCPEGVSVTHAEMLEFAGLAPEEVDARVKEGKIRDGVAAALAMAWGMVRSRARASLVSDGIAPEEARALGFLPFGSVEEALEEALQHHGSEAKVTVLTHAPDTLPVIQT